MPDAAAPRRRPRFDRAAPDVGRLLQAMPPQALEAEMSLLGAMLWDHRVVGDVVVVLRGGEDFARPAHRVIYDAVVELYDKVGAVDVVQLHQRLLDRGILDEVGGLDYLVQLAESVPSAANAVHYAELVREKAILRELIEAAGEILEDAHHGREGATSTLESAEQRIFQIAQRRDRVALTDLKQILEETMKRLEENEGRTITGVATGFVELDEMTSGLQPGEMIILAARPSMGKTALALNLAENIAMDGKPVAIFSLEMSRQQLVQRLLCSRGQIDGQRFRRNLLRQDDYQRLMVACNDLASAPVLIDDTPGLTLLQLRSKARRMKEKSGLEAIVIDYLQLMSAGGRVESRQLEVSEISRGIKAMARELEVPVVCLSQLNRAAEQREGHRPRMSDLRESGSIEQDADVVCMLHREEYYHRSDPEWADQNPDRVGVAELILAKQRNGPTGTVELAWDAGSTRFRTLSHATPPASIVGARNYEAPRTRPARPPQDDDFDIPI
ncbi:MAG: replicative DNA helicase [Phycisphaerales bacterium]|jgi:replicative DNA helicase